MSILSGIMPVVITPFTADGKVDEGSLVRLMDWYIEVGVDGRLSLLMQAKLSNLRMTRSSVLLR